MAHSDDDRPVELGEDDISIIPDQTMDDTDQGWGERPARSHRRAGRKLSARDLELLDERPPHWS
ncbi:hypothetical protein [Salininema proteolyticum]|uniref:Uncharacterized protein n=1 Tax=Salininema proteolyticum TaxID=1607685 RepID=A0ABV8U388_9ACTN